MEVRIKDVIRCSSEDPNYPASNLLQRPADGKKWLCAKTNKSYSVEVEFQLGKAVVISFIDIGNCGSQSASILVSHSMRSEDDFVTLIPAFNFMSVQESKQGVNKTKVMMLKRDNMMASVKDEAWDRIKIVCRQPYVIGKQFGLSLLCVKTISGISSKNERSRHDVNNNQNKLNSFFNFLDESPNGSLRLPKSGPAQKSTKENFVKSNLMESPLPNHSGKNGLLLQKQKTPKMLSPAARAQFAEEVECFLEDVKFDEILSKSGMKVSDLRERMETQRGAPLMKHQKRMFLEIISERISSRKQSEKSDAHDEKECASVNRTPTSLKSTPPPIKDIDIDDVECDTCHISLPASIISIHTEICSKKKTTNSTSKRQNRNSLCWDLGDSSDEEDPLSNKRNTATSKVNDLSHRGTSSSQWFSTTPSNSVGKSWVAQRTTLLPANTGDRVEIPPEEVKTPTRKENTSADQNYLKTPNSAKGNIGSNILETPKGQTNRSSKRGGSSFSSRGKRKASGSFSNRRCLSASDDSMEVISVIDLSPEISKSQNTDKNLCNQTINSNVSKISSQHKVRPGSRSVHRGANKISSMSGSLDNCIDLVSVSTKAKVGSSTIKKKADKFSTLNYANLANISPLAGVEHTESVDWSSPSSGITFKNMMTAKKAKTNNVTEDTQECPICHDQIEKYRIGIHASLCDGVAPAPAVAGVTDQSAPSITKVFGSAKLVECPICSNMMEEDIIQVHVNHCLDSS